MALQPVEADQELELDLSCDLQIPTSEEESFSFSIRVVECLARKGSCVIQTFLTKEELQEAVDDCYNLTGWALPKKEFEAAYLGRGNKSKYAFLDADARIIQKELATSKEEQADAMVHREVPDGLKGCDSLMMQAGRRPRALGCGPSGAQLGPRRLKSSLLCMDVKLGFGCRRLFSFAFAKLRIKPHGDEGSASSRSVGFVGLGTGARRGNGAMGYHMAGHMARRHQCFVWNRSADKAQRHSAEFGSTAVERLEQLAASEVVVFCLPTSAEDEAIVEQVAPHLSRDACVISCTSGAPAATRRMAASLRQRFGVNLLDCPVSGGPKGAAAGSLTCMLGSDCPAATQRALPVVESFAKKVVHCGPVGAGHAVKAVNNALNVSHLMLGAEGLLALQRLGVDPAVALEAINGASASIASAPSVRSALKSNFW
ncbi:unnamed protein product [Effrenium voratum]|nr:unnamed protein product [Effrenium voratum]